MALLFSNKKSRFFFYKENDKYVRDNKLYTIEFNCTNGTLSFCNNKN